MSDPSNPFAPPATAPAPLAPAPPAAAGYAAPPPPGYAVPPPGYAVPPPGYAVPPPGYAAQPPGVSSYFSDAFTWAWDRFGKNWLPLSLVSLVYTVFSLVAGAALAIWYVVGLSALVAEQESGTAWDVPHATFLGWLVAGGLLAWLASPLLSAAALRVARGAHVTAGSVFRVPRYGRVLLSGLLVGALTFVGMLFLTLPGIAVAFVLQFTALFVIDRGLGVLDAVKASYRLATANFGAVAMVYLAMLLVGMVAGVVPVLGSVVATPVSMLMSAYAYVRLTGGRPA